MVNYAAAITIADIGGAIRPDIPHASPFPSALGHMVWVHIYGILCTIIGGKADFKPAGKISFFGYE
jgi:hypothetical protein